MIRSSFACPISTCNSSMSNSIFEQTNVLQKERPNFTHFED